jgi:hypothetical protein
VDVASPALLGSLDNPRLFAGSSVVKAGHETPTQWKHLRGGSSGSDFPAEAAPRGGANNGGEERVDTEAQARESVITQLSDEHGERMVSSLFQSSTAKLAKLGLSSAQVTAWGKSVYMLARRAANCVSPNVQHGDHLNVLHYAAVKLIPSGELCPPEVGEIRGSDAHANVDHGRSECYLYTDGVFARKNLAHKKMRHNIDQPRILLLSGAIEFQRVVSKLAMLDTLLEQEETYMEILVGKIARLQPDILMVGKSVSREAQDMLFKRNISVVLNVEAELMEKVARCTGAKIVTSTDHVDKMGEHVIGTCARFRSRWFKEEKCVREEPNAVIEHLNDGQVSNSVFKNYKARSYSQDAIDVSQPKDDDAAGDNDDGDPAAAAAAKKLKPAPKRRTRTLQRRNSIVRIEKKRCCYIVFEGCPSARGCTLVLRGHRHAILVEIRRMLQEAILMLYDLRMEAAFLRDTDVLPSAWGDYLSPALSPATNPCAFSMSVDLNSRVKAQAANKPPPPASGAEGRVCRPGGRGGRVCPARKQFPAYRRGVRIGRGQAEAASVPVGRAEPRPTAGQRGEHHPRRHEARVHAHGDPNDGVLLGERPHPRAVLDQYLLLPAAQMPVEQVQARPGPPARATLHHYPRQGLHHRGQVAAAPSRARRRPPQAGGRRHCRAKFRTVSFVSFAVAVAAVQHCA